ncbi:Protein of unknown function [Bacillus cereus]|nr:Protein of unknown function [Bacillus cereus]
MAFIIMVLQKLNNKGQ